MVFFLSVNIYLITEDLTVKTKKFSFYEILEKKDYQIELDNENYDSESHEIRRLISNNEMISEYYYDVFDNGVLNDLYKYDFRVIKRFFEHKNYKELTSNNDLLNWLDDFYSLYVKYKKSDDVFIYFHSINKEFVVIKLNEGDKDIHYPAKFLPVIDDRLFNYGISNIENMYFPEMTIGHVNSDIYSCLFVDKYKKEDIFKEDYEKTITLNQLIDFIEKYVNLTEPHEDDLEFFKTRQETFKEQLKLLKLNQKEFGDKKIFSFIIA